MTKLLFTLGVIALGLALGYSVQRLVRSGRLRLPLSLPELRRILQMVGLLGCMYVSFMATVWGIRVESLRITVLPALGAFILLMGGAVAVLLARAWGMSRKQTGSYFACGSFSNIGSVGALVVIVFLGEEGFTSLIPPSIYELDLNLSNACWLTSTLALAAVLPALYLLVERT